MKIRVDIADPKGFDAGGGSSGFDAELDMELTGSRTKMTEATLAERIQTPKGETAEDVEVTEYWFVLNCAPVEWNDIKFSSLLLMPRYRVKKPPMESLEAGEVLIFNGMWRADGKPWDAESLAAAQEGTIEVEGVVVATISDPAVEPAPMSSPFDG